MYPSMIIRTTSYVMISLAVICFFNWLKPSPAPTTAGIVLPISKMEQSTLLPSDVRLLPFAPARYKALAQIHLERHFKQGAVNEAIAERKIAESAKKLASQIGANAVVITSLGPVSFAQAKKESTFFVFRGTAIYKEKVTL